MAIITPIWVQQGLHFNVELSRLYFHGWKLNNVNPMDFSLIFIFGWKIKYKSAQLVNNSQTDVITAIRRIYYNDTQA